MTAEEEKNILAHMRELAPGLIVRIRLCRNADCRVRLERQTHELLENISLGNFEKGLKNLTAIESLLELSRLVYQMEAAAVQLMIFDLQRLYYEITKEDTKTQKNELRNEHHSSNSVLPDLNSEVRSTAIITKIKEYYTLHGNGCGLKELKGAFPDISDRTLQYDLQKLINQGVIIRSGTRGPHVVYSVIN